MTRTARLPLGHDPLPSPSSRIISAGLLIRTPTEPVLRDAAVVVDGTQLAWVGRRAELPAHYAQLPETTFPQGTLQPGLIETHAHLSTYAGRLTPNVPAPTVHDHSWVALSSVAIARQLASVGVTTVQSLGSPHFADVALREAVAAGLVAGPRIVASGPQLTTTGGHAWATGGEVDSVEDIRRAVRHHHKAGADVIKVMATGGFMTTRTAPWNPQFTTAELRVGVEEAHRLGKHTAAHAHATEGIRRAVEAGIDYVAHASFIDADARTRFDPALADLLAERGTFVDTCSPPSWPPVEGETSTPRAFELYRHGVQLVAGNDIGAVLPPSGYIWSLKQLEASGLPRTEILQAATTRAASAVGLAGVTGALAPGLAADLIVTAGNPLDNLDALDQVIEIVIGGRTFIPDPVAHFEPPSASAATTSHPNNVRAAWVDRAHRQTLDRSPVPQP